MEKGIIGELPATPRGGILTALRAWVSRAFLALDATLLWRCMMMAIAILLQTTLDLPRDSVTAVVGPSVGLLVMLVMLASAACSIAAIVVPGRVRVSRRSSGVVLGLCLLAGVLGAHHAVVLVGETVTPATYANDGTTIDHYAAMQLLQGHDPYEYSNILHAMNLLNQPRIFATPLRVGAFAKRGWLAYPSANALRSVAIAAEPNGPAPEFESHVSYPAFSFLALIPFVFAGMPNVVIFSLLSLVFMLWLAMRAVRPDLRPWVALLVLIDAPILGSADVGALDVTVMALLFGAWLLWRDRWWSLLLFGLALATKQQAWFFIPFFGIFLYTRLGWKEMALRMIAAMGVFLAINAPFMLHDFHAWEAGVMAPLQDPMFPRGAGLIQLAISGAFPLLPQKVYAVLEALAFVASIAWYAWRGARRHPELVFWLAMLPLWFAWRSLPSYFLFSALPMCWFWLAEHYSARSRHDEVELASELEPERSALSPPVTEPELAEALA